MPAVTITDHNSAQAFPNAYIAAKKNNDLKINYGVELDVYDDRSAWVIKNADQSSINKDTYVFFDLETTGLHAAHSQIIEIGATKYRGQDKIADFQIFLKVDHKLSKFTVDLTGITDEMLNQQGLEQEEGIRKFKEFFGNAILVAHNAEFDYGFLNHYFKKYKLGPLNNPVIDTLKIARVYIKAASYRLGNVAKKLGIEFDTYSAHRADYDANKLAEVYFSMEFKIRNDGLTNLEEANNFLLEKVRPFSIYKSFKYYC